MGWDDTRPGRSVDLLPLLSELRIDGFSYSDIAVLARSHRILARLAQILRDVNVPHWRVGAGFEVCDSEVFKVIHAALRLVVNPRDDVAFARLRPALSLTETDYAGLRLFAAERGVSHWEELLIRRGGGPLGLIGRDALLSGIRPDQLVSEAIEILETPLGLNDYLSGVLSFWCNFCAGMTVESALRWFALRDSQDDQPTDDVVTLSTVHAAKGLEWPVVIVWGLNEGTFPSSQSLRTEDGVQEERRVCYVAFTRAKERLHVHYRRAEDQAPDGAFSLPSRFLGEAGLLDVSSISRPSEPERKKDEQANGGTDGGRAVGLDRR